MNIRRAAHALLGLCMTAVPLALPSQGQAQRHAQEQAPPARDELVGLARNFVDRIGGGFRRADDYLRIAAPPVSQVEIPDGEILLLQLKLNGSALPDPVWVEKQGNDIMISLQDFVAVTRLPLSIDPAAARAEGWFLAEDRGFLLDADAQKITIGPDTQSLSPGDVDVRADDILVRGQVLARWLDFELTPDLAAQAANLKTVTLWPIEQEARRRQRRFADTMQPPRQPRLDTPYEMIATPNVELNLNQSYNRSGAGGPAQKRTNHNITAVGDFAAHTTRAVISGTDKDKINAVRFTMGRQSETPTLLGPLKARSYEIGDVSPVVLPMTGGTRGGLGVRIGSANPYYTTGSITPIFGDAVPGWDVELYRNNQLLTMVTTGADGRYRFEDVALFAGENIFRIVQYGPRGERREEERRIVSSARLIGTAGAIYDMSVTAAGTQSWAKTPDNSPEYGDINVAGIYERQLSQETSVRLGGRSTTLGDDRKNFVTAGASHSVEGLLLSADVAADIDGALSADITARRNFGAHGVSLGVSYAGENFGAQSGRNIPNAYGFRGLAAGPLWTADNWRVNYNLETDNRFYGDGSHNSIHQAGLNAYSGRFGVSQMFRHTDRADAHSSKQSETTGSTSVRGPGLGVQWRATADYDLSPDLSMRNYTLDMTKSISNRLYGNLHIEHAPQISYSKAQAALSWNAGYAILSPTVFYDSDKNLGLTLGLRSSLSHDPATGKTVVTGQSTANAGGFSALVFLDKNGNLRYDEQEDEILPDVVVRALHAHRAGITDQQGRAFIHDLPVGRATDVIVDENSLPDVFWISAYEGVSVQPRPGYVAHTQFPIHIAGEIDGTLGIRRAQGTQALRGITLILYRPDGYAQGRAVTAPDGFYMFDRVPPGRYYMMISDDDAARHKLVRPQPQEIVIGYDGTVIHGNDIVVEGDGPDVPVGFGEGIKPYLAANLVAGFDGERLMNGVVLNLGAYRSQLLMGLAWYNIGHRYRGLLQGGELLVAPSQSQAAAKTGMHQLLVAMPRMTMGEAVRRCRALAAREIPCRVEIPAVPSRDVTASITARQSSQ